MILHSEFRDGNVPSGYEQSRVFEEALKYLPKDVEKVFLRADTAGYEWDLLRYCAEGRDRRFGVIEFAVGADVTPDFRKAVAGVSGSEWQPLYRKADGELVETGQEWAEVCFVPNRVGGKPKGAVISFSCYPGAAFADGPPSHTGTGVATLRAMSFGNKGTYKLFGVVTNRDIPGEDLIWWHRERCGNGEEAHSVMKEDLAGGMLPSGDLGRMPHGGGL